MRMLFSPQRIITFIISLVFLMESVDTTILNTAIPVISNSLHVEPVDLKIALISYLLGLAMFIPISGWLADKYGAKKVFIISNCVFTFSSFLCGFADDLVGLSCARFFQGLGGAMGLPVGRLIILRIFGQENFILRMNQVIIIGALGVMLGPVIGAVIITYVSWHWIFWVNIPFGFVTTFFALKYLPVIEPEPAIHSLDKSGFCLYGLALAGFTFGLSALSENSIKHIIPFTVILIAAILLILYFFHSQTVKHPILKIKLFKIQTFQVSVIGNIGTRLGVGGMPFLIPLLLQIGLGFSAELSGLLLAPIALGVLIAKPVSIRVLRFFGYKKFLIINTIIASGIICLFSFINVDTPIYLIGFLTFIFGHVTALQYSGMNSLAYADLSTEDLSAGTSIMGTVQQLSQSFGVATAALFIRLFSFLFMFKSLTTQALQHTFVAIGIMTLVSSVIFLKLKPQDGINMIGE